MLVVCSTAAMVEQLEMNWQGERRKPEFTAAPSIAALRGLLREQHWDAVLHCLNHGACTPATT
ncbi:MAG: hypothetical protein Q8J75_01595, partial [Rhodocyclaceae bacterium]|nr:hypothetical protein [Rhodocyclaceae bacterium]